MLTYHISYIIWENDVIQGISQLYRSLAMTKSGDIGQLWASLDIDSDVIDDHPFSLHLTSAVALCRHDLS